MATVDTKKQAAPGNKPAPQKAVVSIPPAPQALSDLDQALVKAIGARVRVVTAGPSSQTIEGTLCTTDRVTNIVAIIGSPSSPSQPADVHFIHVSRIQSFIVVSLPSSGQNAPTFAEATPPIGPVNFDELEKREANAVAREKEKEQRRKQGVTMEAEELFTALGRTLPVRWAGSQMVVNENVLINPPFRSEDCKAPTGNDAGLARVKRVLENERRKYAERANKATNPPPPRKGG